MWKPLAPAEGSGSGVHMCYLEVFFQEGSAWRPLSNCSLRDGDLQMWNMRITALSSQLGQHWVQIRHQIAPLLWHWEPTHWKSIPLSPPELFTIFTLYLGSRVEHKKEKKEGKKRKKQALAGWNIKRLYPPDPMLISGATDITSTVHQRACLSGARSWRPGDWTWPAYKREEKGELTVCRC